ncbi:MAG: hypothetical protein U0Q16_32135 [Bryobacteraceae bacterium]
MLSKLIRRTHLYLALFLTPWVLMYMASTFVMNHRTLFRGHKPPPPRWEKLSETEYHGEPSGPAILSSLGIEGAHQAQNRDGRLVIQRNDAFRPVRVTLEASRLTVERQHFEGAAWLERMHRRRGFQTPYLLDDTWAFLVDLFIAGVLFWALSGLWMWWEMKVTRRWGTAFLLGGVALFAVFLGVL